MGTLASTRVQASPRWPFRGLPEELVIVPGAEQPAERRRIGDFAVVDLRAVAEVGELATGVERQHPAAGGGCGSPLRGCEGVPSSVFDIAEKRIRLRRTWSAGVEVGGGRQTGQDGLGLGHQVPVERRDELLALEAGVAVIPVSMADHELVVPAQGE